MLLLVIDILCSHMSRDVLITKEHIATLTNLIFKPGARRPRAPGFLKSLQCGCVCVCVCVSVCVCVRPRGHE